MPTNSAPIIINKQETFTNAKIKKKTECTVFFEEITIILERMVTADNT
jgi:hypothetical protein